MGKAMSDNRWIWRRDYAIPSDAESGRRVLDELLKQLRAQNWSDHEVFGIRLAAHEALVNAICHGNGLDIQKQVQVHYRISPELVRIEILDEGQGFDPACVPNPTDPERLQCPSGRGVMLMRAYMTRVEYRGHGNCVVLEKRREAID